MKNLSYGVAMNLAILNYLINLLQEARSCPKKKNPDMAELIRGKSGRIFGDLIGLLTVLKGLPLAYNKDMQEDKEGVFDAVKTIIPCLKICTQMVETLSVNKERMEHVLTTDFSNATELADYLAKNGVPFRQAHAIAGKLVLHQIKQQQTLQDTDLATFQKFSPQIKADVYSALDQRTAVKRRNSYGELVLPKLNSRSRLLNSLCKKSNNLTRG